MDAPSTSTSRAARAANAHRAPAAVVPTRPGRSSAFAAGPRVLGVGAPATCFAAAMMTPTTAAHPTAFSADEGGSGGVMNRMYAIAMGSRQAAAGGAAQALALALLAAGGLARLSHGTCAVGPQLYSCM